MAIQLISVWPFLKFYVNVIKICLMQLQEQWFPEEKNETTYEVEESMALQHVVQRFLSDMYLTGDVSAELGVKFTPLR